MKEYDEATLKKVQQTELGILKDFIKVCDENNLTWFGDAGSGIGALRHKGFILITYLNKILKYSQFGLLYFFQSCFIVFLHC